MTNSFKRAKEDTWVFGRLPGSPHYRNVIERAMEVAEQLESKSIGSAHLLLALYHDKESTAQRTLTGLGVPHKKCRDAVLRELAGTWSALYPAPLAHEHGTHSPAWRAVSGCHCRGLFAPRRAGCRRASGL